MQWLFEQAEATWQTLLAQLGSLAFYGQIAIVVVAVPLAWTLAKFTTTRVRLFREAPEAGALYDLRAGLHRCRGLVLPVMAAIALSIATPISADAFGQAWLVRAAQGGAFIFLAYSLASHFIQNASIILILKWIGIPIALLHIVGWLDDVTAYLDGISVEIGNIHITLYAVLRTFIFGVILFWLGRVSNATGQRVIRTQPSLDVGTREVIAKLFEIGVFVLVFLLLMNVMGIDLTALAVFGGALGVGLGFGLQQIASNFISGIIILLDRTITIGDYIELEDGRKGTLRELTMRSATLETFDGKDIMVPNERFITTAFVNWTHYNAKQRYSLNFQVAYDTDLETLFDIVRDVVASHPKVLSGDDLPIAERPDAEIEKFGDSGIDILVEFWMEGIDDGENRVGADLLLMIWTALKANGIEIPFPQREVKLLGDEKKPD
ncbi:MAG: mechanosensitive ion channel [Alphaproteobacteria bacterium]|nr:mechanosensitive ion channel [Alphaproteobacteria bacterium]